MRVRRGFSQFERVALILNGPRFERVLPLTCFSGARSSPHADGIKLATVHLREYLCGGTSIVLSAVT